MRYAVFNTSSGRINKVVQCTPEDVSLQLDTDEAAVLFFEGLDTEYYIEGSETIVKLPTKPAEYCVFDYATKQWVDPRTAATEWVLVRARRDELLAQSDWTQLPDVPLPTKDAWATYRQALRDVTMQPDPFNIVWPTAP